MIKMLLKNIKQRKLNAEVTALKDTPDTSTLIHIKTVNQINKIGKKQKILIKKYLISANYPRKQILIAELLMLKI